MRNQWIVQDPNGGKSFFVVRRPEGARSAWDMEYYVTPGKRWPRRFKDRASAQAFADQLNGKESTP